jgi:hypothetical protein
MKINGIDRPFIWHLFNNRYFISQWTLWQWGIYEGDYVKHYYVGPFVIIRKGKLNK